MYYAKLLENVIINKRFATARTAKRCFKTHFQMSYDNYKRYGSEGVGNHISIKYF